MTKTDGGTSPDKSDARSAFDFGWLVDAAGTSEKRMAQLAILIAGFVMMRDLTSEKGDPQVVHDLYQATLAMDTIAKKMGLEPSMIMKRFRNRVNDS